MNCSDRLKEIAKIIKDVDLRVEKLGCKELGREQVITGVELMKIYNLATERKFNERENF